MLLIMRIGVDVRCLMDGTRTGVEEYALHVLRALMAQAPTDAFLLFANSRRHMRLPAFAGNNVRVRTFAYPNALFNLSLKFLRVPTLDGLLGDIDVFFAPAFRLVPLRAACPLVLTVHDLSFVRFPEFFSTERRVWHRLMEPQGLARRATRLIAVSETTARDLTALYGVDPRRIHVVPSGIPHDMRHPPALDRHSKATSARYGLRQPYVLFLGTLEPRKNLDGLLRAYAAVRRAGFPHFLVLAGVRGWIPEAFFERVSRHPFADGIILTGFVAEADKPHVYSEADLFVYPSFYEGFGFPPLEALACGTPVVTSVASAIPEVAGEWVTLVSPADPEELAMAMIERLRYKTPVPAGVSAAVREAYAWEHSAHETLHVLREAALDGKRA